MQNDNQNDQNIASGSTAPPPTGTPVPSGTSPQPTAAQPIQEVTPQPLAQVPPVSAQPMAAAPAAPQYSQTVPSINPPQASSQQPKRKKREGGILSFFATVVVALILVQVINHLLFQSYRVVGGSMLPTLQEGDLLIISKVGKTTSRISGGLYQPNRNDIIVFQSPKDELQLVKRVIGLPGERVVVKNGQITVFNDEHPDGLDPDEGTDHEDTLPITSGDVDIRIPEGHVFVSGDNREAGNSLDSRNELGTIPEELIAGKLSLRIWPLNTASFF